MKLATVFTLIGIVLASYFLSLELSLILEYSFKAASFVKPVTVVQQSNVVPTPFLGSPIDIRDLPKSALGKFSMQSKQIIYTEYLQPRFKDSNDILRPITYNAYPVDWIESNPISWPSGSKVGFFYNPDGDTLRDTALVIMDIDSRQTKEVYRKSIRTSNWEWDGGNRVIVYYNCGTACLYAYKINVDTGKVINKYHVITDYTPPPVPNLD